MTDSSPLQSMTAAVLAGGQATRLGGGEKAAVELSGKPLIRHVLDVLMPRFKETLVVTPRRDAIGELASGCRIVTDNYRDAGPLGGIHAALMAATTPRVFVVGCDMPFLKPDVMERIAKEASGAEIVLARLDDRDQTLHACYSRDLVMEAGQILRDGGGSPRDLQRRHRVLRLEASDFDGIHEWERSFQSLNTPEDLAAAESAAG